LKGGARTLHHITREKTHPRTRRKARRNFKQKIGSKGGAYNDLKRRGSSGVTGAFGGLGRDHE